MIVIMQRTHFWGRISSHNIKNDVKTSLNVGEIIKISGIFRKLFTAICRWAEAECSRRSLPPSPENKRAVLGAAMQLIRFPLMTVEEFAVGGESFQESESKIIIFSKFLVDISLSI